MPFPAVSIVPQAGTVNVERDFLMWLVANALTAASTPNFVDGSNSGNTQTAGTLTLFNDYFEDEPNNAGFVRLMKDSPNDKGNVPVRDAEMAILIRFGEPSDNTQPSASTSALAAAQAIRQMLQGTDMRYLSNQVLPSGRRVLVFTNARVSPGSLDASGRYEVLVEFMATYIDAITQ